jgi:hypothetical protein
MLKSPKKGSDMHICYKTGFGLAGCYLDDNQGSPMRFCTRKELAADIKSELEAVGFPASCFAEVEIKKLWSAIVRAKSASSYTFHIHHAGSVLTYYGLTRREELEEIANDYGSDPADREDARKELARDY